MSTILKALEKLEREKEALRVTSPIPVLSTSDPVRGGVARWYLKPWFWLSLVGVIIVVLGGTAWHFYRQSRAYTPRLAERSAAMDQPIRRPADARSRDETSPIPDAVKPKPRVTDPTPAGRRDTAYPQATGGHGRPQRPGEPSQTKALEMPPLQEKPAVQQPMPAVRPAKLPDSADQPGAPEKIPTPIEESKKAEAASESSPTLPNTISKTDTPADVYANTPLLTDGRLRVHAIAWAPLPADRMAVINSRILHEGDSVEDFAVMVIRPDDVVVREKGKGVWRVEFGRP